MEPIIDKYFVVVRIHIDEQWKDHPELNTPGGEALLKRLSSKDPTDCGVPFLIFLDPAGKPVVNSDRPLNGRITGDNIGYPVTSEEIDWFMEMLRRGAPAMSRSESRLIQAWLAKASS